MNIERTLLAVSATLLRNLRRDAQLAESIGALSTRRLSTYGQRALEAAADISPAAYVHPSAWLGNSVSVGPFCVVGPRAVIGDGCQLLGNNIVTGDTVLGSDNIVRHGAILGSEDPGKTVIGNGNTIGHHAVIGALCQDLKREPSAECFLRIGNGNDIREFVAIHRSSTPQRETSIRDGNLLMGGCHIAHDVRMGSSNIVGNNSMFAGHVNVGDFVRVSGGVGVQPRCAALLLLPHFRGSGSGFQRGTQEAGLRPLSALPCLHPRPTPRTPLPRSFPVQMGGQKGEESERAARISFSVPLFWRPPSTAPSSPPLSGYPTIADRTQLVREPLCLPR
uniref:Putative acyl-[acyl-carrier-protein]--UDP-N-acetylglucosamine O-acyltransferase, mitochondrial-like n=1 Tax=Tetraselmis sp. GSL018 TaxID=582737 RepID=A0A061R0K2_9CHLO|mmetsp:Transcript_7492/g.17961  ORF Transcript_7492/g.17961 Transcript_7492/m.17961 type:complete len:335 (+) Transcript_7492:102-1106(+)